MEERLGGGRAFRGRPAEVEAIQWVGSNTAEVVEFMGAGRLDSQHADGLRLVVPTLEGNLYARVGDWIARGTTGEVHPVKGALSTDLYSPTPAALDGWYEPGADLPLAEQDVVECAIRVLHARTVGDTATVDALSDDITAGYGNRGLYLMMAAWCDTFIEHVGDALPEQLWEPSDEPADRYPHAWWVVALVRARAEGERPRWASLLQRAEIENPLHVDSVLSWVALHQRCVK